MTHWMRRKKFQSTLPARGATPLFVLVIKSDVHFNPRSPHGERLQSPENLCPSAQFQSTLPARGATYLSRSWLNEPYGISIHAPRTGSDGNVTPYKQTSDISIHAPRTGSDKRNGKGVEMGKNNFNPRSPHGERHQ